MHCQKYPSLVFSPRVLLKQSKTLLFSLPINTKCHCHSLTIYVLAFTLCLPTSTLWHSPSWKTGKAPPQGEMESHGRRDPSLTTKILPSGSSSRNIAGSLCCPKVFHLKEQSIWIEFHFCAPLSLSSDTSTAGKWQSWLWLWRFIYRTRGEILIWEWFVIHEWPDLDSTDWELGPRISAQLSKCLCKLLPHTVTYHFTRSATASACKITEDNAKSVRFQL